jgi:hypothetical protein
MDYLLAAKNKAATITPQSMNDLNIALSYAILSIAEDVRRIADAAQPTP